MATGDTERLRARDWLREKYWQDNTVYNFEDVPICTISDLLAEFAQSEREAQWISVEERLPRPGWVMTYEKMTSGAVRVRWFLANGKFIEPRTEEEGGDLDCTYFVTHWRELPEPPLAAEGGKQPCK